MSIILLIINWILIMYVIFLKEYVKFLKTSIAKEVIKEKIEDMSIELEKKLKSFDERI